MKPEALAFLKSDFAKLFFFFYIRVKTFSNTNLEISMLIKGETRSVPVDVRSSKMACLC